MKWGRILAVLSILWVALLLLSTAFRLIRGLEVRPQEDQSVATIPVSAEWATSDKVLLAYREYGRSNGGIPVLLLHGNPMAGRAMRPLAEELAGQRWVLSPDLPGLGFSSRNLRAYSAVNQTTVLFDWLDQQGIDIVDVIGYSQGGAVALEMAGREPGRVRSVALVSAVGLQEHELLGDYSLNQPIYTAYTAGLWALRWLTPHFGLFDDPVCFTTTAQNFADTDLRRNRSILEHLEQPVLILHSPEDRLVPYSAAKAHATMLPQSYFIPLEGGHMGLFSEKRSYVRELEKFLHLVDGGEARVRSASADNGDEPGFSVKAGERVQFIQMLFVGLLLFLMVFVSEDLSCIGGGILAAGGLIPLWGAVLACFLGIWVSDLLLYFLGWAFGRGMLKLPILQRRSASGQIDYYRSAYRKNGLRVVFLTRFLPGSRVIAYSTAGFLQLGYFRFSVWLFLAALVWTPMLVGAAFLVGQPLVRWWERYGLVLLPVLLLVVFPFYLLIGIITKTFTYRGRAKLRGQWRRLTHWEYWPAFVVYTPVFFYGLLLALRHRSLTLWALCNPGMEPLSGLAMESKSRILGSLSEDRGRLPKWCSLAPATGEARFDQLKRFMEENSLEWPIVLKPDVGQRGEGVAVVENHEQALHYLSENAEPVIAQAYAGGREFGVFYYRLPGELKGEIFSITEKVLPEVVGDGQRNLERLILDHPRYVAQATHYLRVNAERLEQVPGRGESVRLVDLGTHCRGAIFLDAGAVASDALATALDAVVADYEGFHFGRFDLKVAEGHRLQEATAFKVLELNGVSSESTDIYDPKNSLLHGWSKLCRQWKLAFRIGAAQRESGMKAPTLGEVFRVIRQHRRREYFEAADLSRSDPEVPGS